MDINDLKNDEPFVVRITHSTEATKMLTSRLVRKFWWKAAEGLKQAASETLQDAFSDKDFKKIEEMINKKYRGEKLSSEEEGDLIGVVLFLVGFEHGHITIETSYNALEDSLLRLMNVVGLLSLERIGLAVIHGPISITPDSEFGEPLIVIKKDE